MTEDMEEELKDVIGSIEILIEFARKHFGEGIILEFKGYSKKLPIEIKTKYMEKKVERIFNLDELKNYVEMKNKYHVYNNCILFNERYFENYLHGLFLYEVVSSEDTEEGFKKYIINDNINNIEYEVSPISKEYMVLFLLNFIPRINDLPLIDALKYIEPFLGVKQYQEQLEKNPLTQFRSGINSLKIRTKKETDIETLRNLAYSFSYNYSYGRNLSLILPRNFNDLFYNGNMYIFYEDMTFPEKLYNEDLIFYYQTALASKSPVLQYLLFYNILEYLFAKAYDNKIISFIGNYISESSFDSKNDSDLLEFLNELRGKFTIRNKKKLDEHKALKITLEKYVNLKKLNEDLEFLGSEFIDHYKNNSVSFALESDIDPNTILIDFSKEEDIVYNNLRNRIYAIRNSIVHSKETINARFKPFMDEEELILEIPLIRLITHEIIHNSGQNIIL